MLTIILFIFIVGCSNGSKKETNPLIGKIYMYNTPFNDTCDFNFDYVKFYDDYTFQGIKTIFQKNPHTGVNDPIFTNHYGTYDINENTLTLVISDNNYLGVITDNNTLKFGKNEFINWTDNITDNDPILSEFNK